MKKSDLQLEREYIDALNRSKRKKNPSRRKGTTKVHRASQATGKAPSARLVKRRRKNTDTGYFPNPAHAKVHNLHYEVMAQDKDFPTWLTLAVFAHESEAKHYAYDFAKRMKKYAVKVIKE